MSPSKSIGYSLRRNSITTRHPIKTRRRGAIKHLRLTRAAESHTRRLLLRPSTHPSPSLSLPLSFAQMYPPNCSRHANTSSANSLRGRRFAQDSSCFLRRARCNNQPARHSPNDLSNFHQRPSRSFPVARLICCSRGQDCHILNSSFSPAF